MDLKALNICRIFGIGLRDQPCNTFSCSLGVSFENFRRKGCLRVMVLTPPKRARTHVPNPVPRSCRTNSTGFTTAGLIRSGRMAATCRYPQLFRYLLKTAQKEFSFFLKGYRCRYQEPIAKLTTGVTFNGVWKTKDCYLLKISSNLFNHQLGLY